MSSKKPPVSGFTVIRNAEKMGYPIKESLQSLLPLVDELVIGVGQSEDNTKAIIQSLNNPKIKIFDAYWDMNKTTGGKILSEKTNEALEKCQHDWCFYLQADEVLHQDDYPLINQALAENADNPQVQGLLFNYTHFYGSYSTIAQSRKWYRREIRVIKKSSQAQSYKDAQGFRIGERQKLKVVHCQARVFHYGWVKPPELMGQKAQLLDYWWHGDKKNTDTPFVYDNQYGLKPFKETHPDVMSELVEAQDWKFLAQRSWKDWKPKDLRYLLSDVFETMTGHRPGEYRPYQIIK